jgi:hypothetical protein
MSEVFNIYEGVENFINNKCQYFKNEPFITKINLQEEEKNEFPIIHDENNFIKCIMNISAEKYQKLKGAESIKEIKVSIIDSSFELVFYKVGSHPPTIKGILIIVINDIIKVSQNEEEMNIEKDLVDINNEYKILEKLKKFIFSYVKENKKHKNYNGNILEKILFKDAVNDIKFFNIYRNGIVYEDENIMDIIENIKLIPSKIEIKQKVKEKEKEREKEKAENIFIRRINKNINKEIKDINEENIYNPVKLRKSENIEKKDETKSKNKRNILFISSDLKKSSDSKGMLYYSRNNNNFVNKMNSERQDILTRMKNDEEKKDNAE